MDNQQKTWHDEHKASLTKGQQAADYMRNGMGSWPFVVGFLVFMILWAAANTWMLSQRAWDPYPYILLNLFLSMLAGLQGAILLIAAKRQDAIAAAMAEHDLETDLAVKAEIERLSAINDQQLKILKELLELGTARSSEAPAREGI
ncbi:DUF1003 domain-containing protein [Paeniglutamicibacter gangotriensis]|uniref:DUF1003 domain-containing protein n=1 Tax=Paeniglutamicibacter gangotriensis TaxID=254787 RepID=UPI0037C56905